MNLLDFLKLAKEMRTAQKTFFKSKLPGDVAKAKDLEKRFDKALEEGVVILETNTLELKGAMPEVVQGSMPFILDGKRGLITEEEAEFVENVPLPTFPVMSEEERLAVVKQLGWEECDCGYCRYLRSRDARKDA